VRFIQGTFPDYITTDVDCSKKVIRVEECKVKIELWDTVSQERFGAITAGYYIKAAGALLVFDVTNKNSFENITKWLQELKNYNENCVVVIAGNKTDLKSEVTTKEIKAFASEIGVKSIEMSAKKGVNVVEAFHMIAEQYIQQLT